MATHHHVITNRLRRARKIAGYTQRQVAAFLGHKNSARVSSWEKGYALPNTVNLFKLSILYRTLPHDFYIDLYQQLRKQLLSPAETISSFYDDT
jgi:transcriptional regulator with XRE-family HTH domain